MIPTNSYFSDLTPIIRPHFLSSSVLRCCSLALVGRKENIMRLHDGNDLECSHDTSTCPAALSFKQQGCGPSNFHHIQVINS